MDTFMGRYRNVTFLAAAIFLQILGLAIQIKRSTENESSRLIRLWAVSIVAPLEKGIVRVQSSASGVWHNYFYLRGVGAILEQSRLQGVLKGRASGELVIDKIMADEEVKPGDRILTSGGDRIFPKGLPVGTVLKISKGAEFIQVTVKPAAILTHLEE